LPQKVNVDEYENGKLRRRWVDYLQRKNTMTSQISMGKAAVVKELMISSTYTDDDIVSIIHGV
jgi:hypothetical protein